MNVIAPSNFAGAINGGNNDCDDNYLKLIFDFKKENF